MRMAMQFVLFARDIHGSAEAIPQSCDGQFVCCPWRERLREAMPKLPRFGRAKADEASDEIDETTTKRKRKTRPAVDADDNDEPSEQTRPNERREASRPVAPAASGGKSPERDDEQRQPTKRGWSFGLGKLALRPPTSSAAGAQSATENRAAENRTADSPRSQSAQDAEVDREYGKKSGWFGRRKEVAKNDESGNEQRSNRQAAQRSDKDSEQPATNKRSLRDRFAWKRKELTEEQIARARSQESGSTKVAS